MKFKLPAACLAATLAVVASVPVLAQAKIDKRQFNVVGTWGFLSNWQNVESVFWKETLPKASAGQLTANAKSQTDVNLKGTEVLRLLKSGVFDFVAALPIYVDEGGAIIEGVDIAGVAKDFKMAREVTELWLPEVQKVMKERYNAQVLSTFPFPEQVFFCRDEIKSAEDLKGKKVRVQGVSQGDFVTALGGAPVTIPFAEVLPALEKGVVDCGITGTMPGYKARWYEVVKTLYRLPVNYTIGFWAVNLNVWNKLSKPTQELITAEMNKLTDRAWDVLSAETEEGIHCNTGGGKCSVGAPGKVKLAMPTDADLKLQKEALNTVVLPSWAKRCSEECVSKWNQIVGAKYGLTAKK